MKQILLSLLLLSISTISPAASLLFQLHISSENFDPNKRLELSNLGEGGTALQLDFFDKAGNQYGFDLKYKKLPVNRAFLSNLHITPSEIGG
ncbi:Uncharacterised protein [BD1-7 clade bacterium]|uniref:Uncharacterized protein n=1 Tax=BD1-7 clade bacterium TaxID=2029982 RepID=A0A5S9P5S3_9GAMM|nr:Uncharacterised protein [BD1-7 clade bacterium]